MKTTTPCLSCGSGNARPLPGNELRWACMDCKAERVDLNGDTKVEAKLVEEEAMPKKKGKRGKSATNGAADHQANGQVPIRQPVERKPHTRPLPCKIDDPKEIEQAAQDFTALYRRREATLEERRSAMAGFKDALTGIDEKMAELATTVEDHLVTRSVECIERFYVETQTVEVVRLDSGEIVETRTANAGDAQDELFAADGTPKAPEGAEKGKSDEGGDDSGIVDDDYQPEAT